MQLFCQHCKCQWTSRPRIFRSVAAMDMLVTPKEKTKKHKKKKQKKKKQKKKRKTTACSTEDLMKKLALVQKKEQKEKLSGF